MAIRFKAVVRKSPMDKRVKYYAQQHTTPMSDKQFVENIVQTNTCTRADVLAVLASIKQELVNCIRNGQSVTLGEIGTFRFTIKSKGAATADKVTSDLIRSVHIRFLPSAQLRYDCSRENPAVTFLNETPAVTSPSETPAVTPPSETPAGGDSSQTPSGGDSSQTPSSDDGFDG
ncbi:MAG: HU family DNA-binding protein [Alloprevotella sp.]|nr:HU family DNA-binding protein [Alloprevotella sp.]